MINLSGKVALITGSTRGIGLAIADLFEKQGCSVIRTGTKGESTDKYISLDLYCDKSISAALKKIEMIPKIDILVNNAGINVIDSINEVKIEDWDKIIKINLTGPMLLTKIISKKMIESRISGRILNISSIFGHVSREKRNAYSASKSGILGLTRASSLDLAQYNILVNALCVGFTLTELTQSILSPSDIKDLESKIPLKRLAQPEEIAKTALFLCSNLNQYVTGQTLTVDGGVSIRQ